ncbi:MAG: AAA family ATPase [Candidatus Binatia bacterium]|nr:AAA family ATPase [Candidatus Binatia bacterium]
MWEPPSAPDAEGPARIRDALRRSELFRALRAILLRAAETRPLIFVVEDLHWVDPASEEFLQFLAELIPASLLAERRRSLHRTIGAAIEELYADRLAEHFEVLAHHFARRAEWSKALGIAE